jgi:hypothetical protein
MTPEQNDHLLQAAATPYPAGCPLKLEFDRLLDLSQDLTQAFQMLRKKRSLCEACSQVAACPFWAEFDAQVSAAIRDVLRERGRL